MSLGHHVVCGFVCLCVYVCVCRQAGVVRRPPKSLRLEDWRFGLGEEAMRAPARKSDLVGAPVKLKSEGGLMLVTSFFVRKIHSPPRLVQSLCWLQQTVSRGLSLRRSGIGSQAAQGGLQGCR